MSNNTTYYHTTSPEKVEWSYMKIIRTVFCASQLFLNTAMLIAFFVRRSLRTPFTVYIMCLLASNIIYAGGEHPFEIIFQTYKTNWMSPSLCTFYLYLFWVWCGVPMHIHMLITINRIWAIAFPHTYKRYHSAKVAYALCGLITLYVHIIGLPLVLLDRMQYALDVKKKGCAFNFDVQIINDYTTADTMVVFDLPILVVVVAYPFLLYKQINRNRRWKKPDDLVSHRVHPTSTENASNHINKEQRSKSKESTRPFLVLTFLTASIFLFWTPTMTYWTIVCFIVPSWDTYTVPIRNVVSALFAFQPVLDPVWFALSLQSFRVATARLFCKTRVRQIDVSAVTSP